MFASKASLLHQAGQYQPQQMHRDSVCLHQRACKLPRVNATGAIADEVNLRQLKTLDPTDVAAASAVGEAVINTVGPTAAH